MSNEIVKYHNDFNKLSMRNWSTEEVDMLFSIIAKLSNQGTKLLKFDTDELKILTGSKARNSYWYSAFKCFIDKASILRYIEDDGKSYSSLALFTKLKYDGNKTLEVSVSEEFEYIVNCLDVKFSSWELSEFTNIRSTYLKTMYRNIKQWKSVGELEWSVDKLRRLLEVPESYTSYDINRRIINPAQKILPNYIKNFKIKIVKSNKQGTPIIAYKFTWEKQLSSGKYIPGKYNKKSKPKLKDDRMTREERKAFIEHKIKQNISFKPPEDEEIDGQIDVNYYLD